MTSIRVGGGNVIDVGIQGLVDEAKVFAQPSKDDGPDRVLIRPLELANDQQGYPRVGEGITESSVGQATISTLVPWTTQGFDAGTLPCSVPPRLL